MNEMETKGSKNGIVWKELMVNVKFGRSTMRNILFSQLYKLQGKRIPSSLQQAEPMTFHTPGGTLYH